MKRVEIKQLQINLYILVKGFGNNFLIVIRILCFLEVKPNNNNLCWDIMPFLSLAFAFQKLLKCNHLGRTLGHHGLEIFIL